MLDFQPITKDAVSQFLPYLQADHIQFCDFSPVNLYIWCGYFYKAFAVCDGLLFLELFTEDGSLAYAVPIGDGDKEKGLKMLREQVESRGETLELSLVCAEDLPLLRNVFGELHHVTSESEWSDYIYDAHKMASFEGSVYAKQRNHVRRFERCYPHYRVERLKKEHLSLIDDFLVSFPEKRGKSDALAKEEITRTKQALLSMDDMGLFGVVLFVDERLVGFSAGSRLRDMLYVNFEKADTDYDGVYQMLVKAFASAFVDDTTLFINREEDCGDEGLRKSKRAYHPIKMLEKYTVRIK